MNQQNNQAVPPRRSMRLATIIPASHWISIGYSELDARLMEKLQQDMKNYCDSSDETEIRLEGRMGPIAVLPYHDIKWTNLYQKIIFHRYFSACTCFRYYVSCIAVN